ncbi:MAG: Gfo/Idh/MocA family oxidoreductase [Clostridiales bacterium]|nr:Gfo/Idh/MocA family oxidoreductase [Clostridiales bacterium]
MENRKVRLGIIGLGNMGSGHAKNIVSGKTPEIELAAAADIAPEKLESAKDYLPESVKLFPTAEEMLDSGLIDAAIVAVPHYDHPKYVIACIEKGIHVMCEKPAGVYTKQVREMNAVAAAHPDVVFGMMFNQRTNHIYRKMRELVKSGKYGQIRRTNWLITTWFRSQAYYDSGAWRASWRGEGGGVLLNQCPHQLDLWQWICGLPVRVDSHLSYGKWHNIEVEDDVTTYVEYANGATGVFVTSTGDVCGTNRFEIQLDGAKIVASEDKLRLWEYEMSTPEFEKVNREAWNAPKVTEVSVETDGENPQHVGVLNAFAANILRGEPLVARGEEGINGLTLSNAMHLSSWLGRPVEIPFDEDLYWKELSARIGNSVKKN